MPPNHELLSRHLGRHPSRPDRRPCRARRRRRGHPCRSRSTTEACAETERVRERTAPLSVRVGEALHLACEIEPPLRPRHRAATASFAGRWWRRGARSGGPTASPPPRAPWRGCASAARAPGPDRRYRGRVAPARPRTVELPVAENEALGRDRWSSCENTIDSATVDLRFEVRAQTGDRGGRPTVHPGRPSVERIGSMSHTQMAVAVKDGRWCRRLPR